MSSKCIIVSSQANNRADFIAGMVALIKDGVISIPQNLAYEGNTEATEFLAMFPALQSATILKDGEIANPDKPMPPNTLFIVEDGPSRFGANWDAAVDKMRFMVAAYKIQLVCFFPDAEEGYLEPGAMLPHAQAVVDDDRKAEVLEFTEA